PNYNKGNSLMTVMRMVERMQFAVDREWYLRDSLQYLFPIDYLELYGPAGGDVDLLDPTRQDNKTDFQKQNVRPFRTSTTPLVRGDLQVRPDIVHGSPADFEREKLSDRDVRSVAPDCSMHPLLPLHLECAWANDAGTVWDSNGGRNYHYEFDMIVRGWDNFLG